MEQTPQKDKELVQRMEVWGAQLAQEEQLVGRAARGGVRAGPRTESRHGTVKGGREEDAGKGRERRREPRLEVGGAEGSRRGSPRHQRCEGMKEPAWNRRAVSLWRRKDAWPLEQI